MNQQENKPRTFFEEILQVLDCVEPEFWFRRICANKSEDIVGEDVGIGIGTVFK